jgi:phosphate transport system protein
MAHDHIVRSYDEELRGLHDAIVRMGGLVEAQLAGAIAALIKRDSSLAATIIEGDDKVDELNIVVDTSATRLLALRQPLATDLRSVISAFKISSDLERMADYASNVAKRAIALSRAEPVRPLHAIPRMASLVAGMIKDVLDAYVERDVGKAIAVWQRDEEVDEIYNSLFRELLTYMMEDPRNITAATHLLFCAKNIERIGDHATNIAETVHFLVKGERLQTARPKGDLSSFALVQLPTGKAKD